MPGLLGIGEFLSETRDDYNSPTTSTFVSRMPQCRQTINVLEETLDGDREGLSQMKKAVKAIYNSGNSHVDNEMYFYRALDKLGSTSLTKDQEPDISAAFIKFSVVTKELSILMKTLMKNLNNIVLFPLDSVLKGDLKGVKGDMKRPFDRALKDYEAKYSKIEKEKKQQAKEAGLIRTEVTPAEVADEMEKERKLFQLQMCEYLIKVNEIKTKKGIELLQHLVEYYHAQTKYFQDGLETLQHFGSYIQVLSTELQRIRQKQDEERRQLVELRNLLRSAPGIDKDYLSSAASLCSGYSLHQLQGDKQHGFSRVGHLLKKSEGKVRKVWQKRRCHVKDGFLDICHGDESKEPTRINLLTCQIKLVPDDKRCFDLISYNRTYHFQAEDEADQFAWMSVLVNSKEGALMKAFGDSGRTDKINPSLLELQQAIIHYIQKMPGNDRCCDCNSQNDATWLSTNFGIIVCIECSGIHRDLGVHISRIQSLTLDNIGTSQLLLARHMTNSAFNDVMEATLRGSKPTAASTMEERNEFIRAKYLDKKFALHTCSDTMEVMCELENALENRQLHHLLQVFAEGADFTAPLPTSGNGESALHWAVAKELGNTLHIVDFVVQNSESLNRTTYDGNTALHYCAMHRRPECMKLLLRSGADPQLRNHENKTPLDIAREMGNSGCEELMTQAMQQQKVLFDNVNFDWNLSHDEASTDFSDDETIIEDRIGAITPEKSRSRPPSFAGVSSANFHGSLKKRAAPLPPVIHKVYGTLPSSHSRTPSDPIVPLSVNIGRADHKKSPTFDSGTNFESINSLSINNSGSMPSGIHLVGAKLVLPMGEIPHLKSTGDKGNKIGVQRPQNPPPPTPTTPNQQQNLSNGRSNENIPGETLQNTGLSNPVPPPRRQRKEKRTLECGMEEDDLSTRADGSKARRCRALYSCDQDQPDELSFDEGEVIIITKEETEEESWMEGFIEGDPTRRGLFPVIFVKFLE
ncbi:arfGAP with SH3 domain, ANK repeat and PH domain-containing protein isoform X2 [Neocloeon triangulifer]|uniref:arfGAP with SH3 domain, ANK repeat and PH domain-containing protein isoform X2 n=1 Tax=Neocloeon triangulifer TaxID=2078957 RepID=UPI00286F0417|nr:arfGAP with SH3 domain, ANK repeat and PH domain-containing protein isoform X2 [Neocloeon triangulifer]